jgi:hypothetical protein
MSNYSLQQAQTDIANTRYILAALQNSVQNSLSGFAPVASPTFTGTVTFPDGSTWSVSGLTLNAPLPLAQGGTGYVAASNAALLSHIGGAPLASPTFTGTVTMPDGTTWTTSGIVSPTITGTLTAPDGSTWNSSGLTIAAGKFITLGSFAGITGDTGWSAISGYAVHKWRQLPDGNIQFSGASQHTSITATLAINSSNPLPAGVRPSSIKKLAAGNSPLSELNVEYHTDGILYALANGSSPGTKAIIQATVDLT